MSNKGSLVRLRQILDEDPDESKGYKAGRISAYRRELAKFFDPRRYLNFEINYPTGYPRLNLGDIELVALSPSQLFTADTAIPLLGKRGEVKIADTGTGKTIAIFNVVLNALQTERTIPSPIDPAIRIPHQVIVVTKAALVLDMAKDLSILFSRDSAEVRENWQRTFELPPGDSTPMGAVPFNHHDYVMSYAQFQNMLLGRAARGRRFWAGQVLLGNKDIRATLNRGKYTKLVPTAYHATTNGYVRGNLPHSIATKALDRIVTLQLKKYVPPTKGPNRYLKLHQELWIIAGVLPDGVTQKGDFYYNWQKNKPAGLRNFDAAKNSADMTKFAQMRTDLIVNQFAEPFFQVFKRDFNGRPGYDKFQSIDPNSFQIISQRSVDKFQFAITWEATTNEAEVSALFQETDLLEVLFLRSFTPYNAIIANYQIKEVKSSGKSGWKLIKEGNRYHYVPTDQEIDFNPCDNITVIFDEAHLLVKTEGLEAGEIADFDLISQAMQESNMVAYFFSATLTLYPLMALIQALHPVAPLEGGLSPNRAFVNPYPQINHYQQSDPVDLANHYMDYFSFGKDRITFTDVGKQELLEQANGLISYHPDISTQLQHFSRPDYGGPDEIGHVIKLPMRDDQVLAFLRIYQISTVPRLRRLINFYDGTFEEPKLKYRYGAVEFDMGEFAKQVCGVEGYCYFARALLKLIRDCDEEEAKMLLPGERLSRITIATATRDLEGANLIAGILQAAGYEWVKVGVKKLTPRQRTDAETYWAQNRIPPAELRKIDIKLERVDTAHDAELSAILGPSERRKMENSIRFVTFSTSLVDYVATSANTLEELTAYAQEHDYATPWKAKKLSALKDMDVVYEDNAALNEFFLMLEDKLVFFWPGTANKITDSEQLKLLMVDRANSKFDKEANPFFYQRFSNPERGGGEGGLDVRKLTFPHLPPLSDKTLPSYTAHFIPNQELDAEGKRELVQSLRELTNERGQTNNEVGIAVIGNKFESGIDVFGSTALISVEPYADWTSEVQKNGRNNRRGGMSEFRYERWIQRRYAITTTWTADQVDRLQIKIGRDNVEEPTLKALQIMNPEDFVSEDFTTSRKSLKRYSSAVITSILRHPILDQQANPEIIEMETLLQPYQIIRIKAIKHPVTEVLNLIGGLKMADAAFDLPFIQPLRPEYECNKRLALPERKDDLPACVPTKYQLSIEELKRLKPASGSQLDFVLRSFESGGRSDYFPNLVRNSAKEVFVQFGNHFIKINPEELNTTPEQILFRLCEMRLAFWQARTIQLRKPKKKKREQDPSAAQSEAKKSKKDKKAKKPKEAKSKKKSKDKSKAKKRKLQDHFAAGSHLLHYRVQPNYESLEKASSYTKGFYSYIEGDFEQSRIEEFYSSRAVEVARVLGKWNDAVDMKGKPDAALKLLRETLGFESRLPLQVQRSLQQAVSVMQYYGILNWNISVIMLCGISTTFLSTKTESIDFIDSALFAAQCCRASLIRVESYAARWDLDYGQMNLKDCTYLLSLLSSWSLGDVGALSRRYRDLADEKDEVLDKIFSELYYNFYLSIRKNLSVYEKITYTLEKNKITTAMILSGLLRSDKEVACISGADWPTIKSGLKDIVNSKKGRYGKLFLKSLSQNNLYIVLAKAFSLDQSVFIKQILTSTSAAQFINGAWPEIERVQDENVKRVLQFYKTKEDLIAEIQVILEEKKQPSMKTLLDRMEKKMTKRKLPFVAVDQTAANIKQSLLKTYNLSTPDDYDSSVLEYVKKDKASVDLGRNLLSLIRDDKLVYRSQLDPQWSFGPLAQDLLGDIVGGVQLEDDELIALLKQSLPNLLNNRTLSAAKQYFRELFVNSALLNTDSPLAIALRDRFEPWLRGQRAGAEVGVEDVQRVVIESWLRASGERVEKMFILLSNIMPKANRYWELLSIQGENMGPNPEFLDNPAYLKNYLVMLNEVQVTPADLNYNPIVEFKRKLNMIRFTGLSDAELVEAMASVDLNALVRNKTNVPGVSIFTATARQLVKNVETSLLAMEGVEKPKPIPRPKRKAEVDKPPTPGILDLSESEEDLPPTPPPEEEEIVSPVVVPSPDDAPALPDIPDDIFMSSLCRTCFLPTDDPVCQCN